MASITINIADADLPRVISGLCSFYGYQATIPSNVVGLPDTPNPESQSQFARRMVVQGIKSAIVSFESQQASVNAIATATESANQVGIS